MGGGAYKDRGTGELTLEGYVGCGLCRRSLNCDINFDPMSACSFVLLIYIKIGLFKCCDFF